MSAQPALEGWVADLEAAFGAEGTTDIRATLDLVREVAHRFDRPAGPLAAYLAGVAVGRGTHSFVEATSVIESALAKRTEAPAEQMP